MGISGRKLWFYHFCFGFFGLKAHTRKLNPYSFAFVGWRSASDFDNH